MADVGVVTHQVAGYASVGTDDSHRFQGLRERQQVVLVLQQHDGLLRNLARQRAVSGGIKRSRRLALVHPGVLEQAKLELGAQHPGDALVDDTHVDLPGLGQRTQRLAIAIGAGQFDVDARLQRDPGRCAFVRRDMVRLLDLVDREVVGDYDAVKPPLVAQDLGQQLARGRAGHAVDLVVAVHH